MLPPQGLATGTHPSSKPPHDPRRDARHRDYADEASLFTVTFTVEQLEAMLEEARENLASSK